MKKNKQFLFFLFYIFLAIIFLTTFQSCGKKQETASTDELKKRELDLKEKELNLKEQELNKQKDESQGADNTQSRLFPQASERLLTSSDVENLNSWELKIMRNEIFAAYGYIFKTEEMKNYFAYQKWYEPRYNDVNDMLTGTEKKNIELIKRYESRLGNNDFSR